MNPPRHTVLAALLAVLVMLCGLAGSASAAFNHAATEPHYGNFSLWESEASGFCAYEFADPTKENGKWIYDGALGVPVYVRQNPWTFFDPLGLKRYKGSDASDKDWNKLDDKAKESLKDYRDSGGTMQMLKDAGFDPSQEITMSSRKVQLTTAGEVEFQMWKQGENTLYTRDVWGAAEGGGTVASAGVQGWDNWGEFKQDMNMDAFWRGKGGEAFQRGIGVAAGFSGGLGKPNISGATPNGANIASALNKANPNIGQKLNYFLGQAGGNAHNVQRSTSMLRQLESIGLHDNPATRKLLTQHLTNVMRDPSNITKVQESGRVVRESLLMGQNGGMKFETVWEGTKLITGKLIGGK